jgi:hypothetical protein
VEPKFLLLVCARLVFLVALLIQFLQFPSSAMASGSKEGESLLPLFWLFCAQAPCMLVPILDLSAL